MNIILIAILLVCIIAIILIWVMRQTSSINDYFCNAVKVWVFMNKKDAKIAAVAAAKVADGKQRKSMLKYLSKLAADLDSTITNKSKYSGKVLSLKKEIAAHNWTIMDAAIEKDRLAEINPNYLKALNKADARIFVRQYPDFFKFG